MPKSITTPNSIDKQNIVLANTRAKFRCPYCGTYFVARDLGFNPNCNNCGSLMRKE